MKKSRLTIHSLPEGGYIIRQSPLFPVCGWVLLALLRYSL